MISLFFMTRADGPQASPLSPQLTHSKESAEASFQRLPDPRERHSPYAVYRFGSTESVQEGFLMVSRLFRRNML